MDRTGRVPANEQKRNAGVHCAPAPVSLSKNLPANAAPARIGRLIPDVGRAIRVIQESIALMSKRMLIDATQAEETQVVLLGGNRVENFALRRSPASNKGNIYLALVTRVEPSLQAAFVEYGGNRHGFLAFSEVHPDYYRIPVEDREALLAEAHAHEESAAGDDSPVQTQEEQTDTPADHASDDEDEHGPPAPPPESIGGDDMDGDGDVGRSRKNLSRRYKIQEVITRRQIMLVQVVKEERGNKGAALTTYLSLAGRYCVLMPNTARGGGVSRKITNIGDRKRLKQIVEGLDVPEGMAVIVRTAGSERTKTEIKRDYEYLLRLWDQIRDKTLTSTAPCLIYEEADLIKRSIRDLYTPISTKFWSRARTAIGLPRISCACWCRAMPSVSSHIRNRRFPCFIGTRLRVSLTLSTTLWCS